MKPLLSTFYLFFFFAIQLEATNPVLSNFLANLSAKSNSGANDDVNPEMVIIGNTIHVVWLETDYHNNKLYYCRSTDFGKTWEVPKFLANSKGMSQVREPQNRKMAVDGNNVHIAFFDSNESDSGAKMIYYVRSTDNGGTFGPVKELVKLVGGYASFSGSHIKAANGKVAIVYHGTGWKNGVFMLFSANNGGTFTEKPVTDVLNGYTYVAYSTWSALSDFWYDGNQMVVVFEYQAWSSSGKVWVSVSNNDAETFVTTKVSFPYNVSPTAQNEYGRSFHDGHYSPKIAKSGDVIHVVFTGVNENSQLTTLYARSTDKGKTFEKAQDINKNILDGASRREGQETVVAKNGHVYLAYLSKAANAFFVHSADNGNTFSTSKSLVPDGSVWWISLVADASDVTGSTVYLISNGMFSTRSTDGGKNFSQYYTCSPFLESNVAGGINSDMTIDSKGNKHWISGARWRNGTDQDIFYKFIGHEPEPGTKNKAYSLDIVVRSKWELLVVPSSPSLDFDSAMTAEAWVKFDDPASIIYYGAVNILGKNNGTDGADFQPSGYNMGFRTSNGKMVLNSGLKTDKGDFVNWGNRTIGDTLWHHIAYTYDAKGGLNNFKTYVDGLLSVEQTVTGKIVMGNGMLMIGSRESFNQSAKYHIDNIRLWNKALSQDELLKNQLKTFTGKEEGLKLFLNFDDTFKDISGNGNDGIPLYWGVLKASDFNPPVPEFDLYQTLNQVSLTNKTQNGTAYSWNFGDGTTSTKGNPVYTYTKPGEYSVTLEATNTNSKTAMIKNTTFSGLNRIEPTTAGNVGYASFTVFGGGINSNSKVKLVKEGVVIKTDTTTFIKNGELNATFNLEGQPAGKYDVVINITGAEYTLKEALTIEAGIIVDPYVYVSGRNAVLSNRWQVQTVIIGNTGNTDLFNIPLFIAVSNVPGIELEFINIDIVLSNYSDKLGHSYIKDTFPTSLIQENYFSDSNINNNLSGGKDAMVFPLMIENLPQNSSMSIFIRIKSIESYELVAWAYGFSESSILKSALAKKSRDPFGDCLWEAVKTSLYNATGDGINLIASALKAAFPVGCAKATFDTMNNAYKTAKNGKPQIRNTLWDLTSVAVSCGAYLTGAGQAYDAALNLTGIIMTGYNSAYDYYECWKNYAPSRLKTLVANSFDPNEMIGPSGYGNQHWIQKNKTVPYTILFENKSTATAPAHIVTIRDTLDMTKFDLAEFGFGSFGWGDTIFNVSGNKLKKFSRDIDMRPKTNLITRVSGKLDTIKGIITWEFLSLNPVNMNLEEDPFIGFLPPNKKSPVGEGFVSFSVGLKKELKTNDVLKNKASIVFDANKPIITNLFVNTLDLDKPESKVLPLDATIDSHFPITWGGTDNGSGVAGYSVYVLENDTALRAWKVNTTLKTDQFIGKVGSKYKFYSIATDNVSLKETEPSTYDAATHVIVHVDEFEMKKAKFKVFPNPADEKLNIHFENAPCGMYLLELIDLNGKTAYSQLHSDSQISSGIEIDVSKYTNGQYLLWMVYGNKTESRKIIIQ